MELLELVDLIKKRERSLNLQYNEDVQEMKADDVDYTKFYTDFLMANKPCLIKSITTNWNSQINWVCDNKPNYIYLKRMYGQSEVPVANCSEQYFNSQSKSNMKLNDFLDYWKKYADNNYPQEMPCLYLKDWHFMNQFPDECIYRVPNLFASDWMNEYLVNSPHTNDDYRFVYMGPKGSWTPLHADVFSSFSWSVNICGKKKWIFYPPGAEDLLKDKFGKLIYDVNSKDLEDSSIYPNYRSLNSEIILIQEVSDAIFVPSGWHHQVWNMEDTISINHNWINACNIQLMWKMLEKVFSDVKTEISDCKDMVDWEQQCQILLKCTFGMNYADFINFLIFIVERRLENLKMGSVLSVNGNWFIGRNHMLFDLLKINPIFNDLISSSLPCVKEFKDLLINHVKTINNLLEDDKFT